MVGHWAKVSVLIGILQLPIYGHLPVQLFIMMGAVVMASWPSDALGTVRGSTPATGMTSAKTRPPGTGRLHGPYGDGLAADRSRGPADETDEAAGVRQAARGSAFNLIGAVTAAVVSFFTVGLITNFYGQSKAGVFFAATALFTLAANGARLGAETSLTFFVSRLRAEDRRGAVRSVTTTALRATTVVATLFGVAGFVWAPELAALLAEEEANTRSLTSMIRILAVAAPLFSLSQAMFGASRGFGTMRRRRCWPARWYVRSYSSVLVVAVIALAADVASLAWAWTGAAMASLVVIAVWLHRRLRRVDAPPERFRSAKYWRFAAPRAVTDLVSSALERLDPSVGRLLPRRSASRGLRRLQPG